MKLDDVFFAIGIIIISSLLVFVIYDDTMGSRYQEYVNENMELNSVQEINITEEDLELMPDPVVNNTTIKTKLTVNTVTKQSSGGSGVTAKKVNSESSFVQSFKPETNNIENNVKRYNPESNIERFQNTPNDKTGGEAKQPK